MRPITLGGYPAKQCPRAIHNEHSPASPPKPPHDARTLKLFQSGNDFEEAVNARLAVVPGTVLMTDADGWDANADATVAAMRAGAPMIVNGRFPPVDAMAGAPDVLVRVGDGYVPIDIKGHRTRHDDAAESLWLSPLSDASERRRHEGLRPGWYEEPDGFQLAHYTRILQRLGLHAGDDQLIGGIIGTSDFTDLGGDPWFVVWYDLSAPRRDTFSASAEGERATRSLLERYDHEFAFRLLVAETARAGGELVRPFHISECSRCAWFPHCSEVAGPDDASFAISDDLPTAQQWRFLYDAGVTTLVDLARLDPDDCPAGWIARDPEPTTARTRFRDLIHQAMARLN